MKGNNAMKHLFYILGLFIGSFITITLIWGGIVWVMCWALIAIGVTTIGSWTVAFSWKLVLIVALTYTILRNIFAPRISSK
jgi:uncharacterized membrane protein